MHRTVLGRFEHMKTGAGSLPQLLDHLWRDGFFSQPRDSAEIAKRLSASGYHFSLAALCSALLRAVRPPGLLTRTMVSGKWKYAQRCPPLPASGQKELLPKYDFHPRIKKVAIKQFENKDFKGAIQNALVEVIHQVKIKTNNPTNANGKELDGDDLMNQVFGCDNQIPKIKFNNLQTSLDKAEQRGLMYLFKGIVGVRDRKAHLNFIQNDSTHTVEYLSLASLLMRLLDKHSAKRTESGRRFEMNG